MERTGLKRAQEAVLPLWERTRLFRAYSSWLIPGAVQTRAYTTAVLRAIAARGAARRCFRAPRPSAPTGCGCCVKVITGFWC